jgi:MacB-like periplasmic core domain
MSLFRRIWSLRSRAKIDREIEDELDAHLQMRTADNVAAGMPVAEARRDAVLRFGNPTAMKERVAGVDTALNLDNLWNDVRFAGRRLWKSPGFSITAILTLALGIAATTAIFSAAYAVLLRSLPFMHADRIVAISETHPQIAGGGEVTFPDYLDWRSQQSSFEQMAGYSIVSPETVSLVWNGHAEQVHRVLASSNLFSLLGVAPSLGRIRRTHSSAVADTLKSRP